MDKIGRFANAYTLIIICFCVDWMNGKHIFYSFAAKILPAVVHAVIQQYGRDLGKVYRADQKVPLTEIIDLSRMVLFISDRFCKNLVGTLVFTVIGSIILFRTPQFSKLVESNIKAIWNFTPYRIKVPRNIVLQNTSIYSDLAIMYNRMEANANNNNNTLNK